MKRMHFTLLIFISLGIYMGIAQYSRGTIYFKNGDTLNGLCRFKTQNKVVYKKEKKGEKIEYKDDEITKIVLTQNMRKVTYKYIQIDDEKHPTLLEVLHEGKLNLYVEHSLGTTPMTFSNGGFQQTTLNYYPIDSYFVSKEGNNRVTQLTKTNTLFQKSFKKAAAEYFKDCPVLAKKIEHKEYKKRDLLDIVIFYNEDCN